MRIQDPPRMPVSMPACTGAYNAPLRFVCRFLLAFALVIVPCTFSNSIPCQAQSAASAEVDSTAEHAHASLIADTKSVAPGKKFRLGVVMKMDPEWHTYYKESGDAGMPTSIAWELPPGFKAGELMWEKPHKLVDAGIVTYGYNDLTVIASEITAPENLKVGDKLQFKAKVKWLVCKDACIPGKGSVELTLPVEASLVPDNADRFKNVNFKGSITEISDDGGKAQPAEKKQNETSILAENFKVQGAPAADLGIWGYLVYAFIGGFILNFMPCVLPVISIKIFSLIKQAGEEPKAVFKHGVTFALGIVLSFMSLGALVIAIQGVGQKIGWGFQFQYPVFDLGMAAVITLFALSMFGVFYFDLTAGQKQIDELASKEGLVGTFFKGVLATVLSTPCTAPFLGAVLGFAFVQPWWIILSLFFVIALGMSFPYLVLAVHPAWLSFMPKPGDWMVRFKESMGFLLLATVIWLISVLSGLVDPDAVIAAISFLVCLSVACWLVGGFIDLTSTSKRIMIVWAFAALVVGIGYWLFIKPFPELLGTKATIGTLSNRNTDQGIQWQNFSVAELDKQLKANKTVFIDFTAKWCLTCKVNEGTIINTPPVIEKFKALNVVALKADWTAQDPEISDLLRKFGRSGVPVYVIFPAGKSDSPVVLPEALTQPIVLDALEKAGPSK